MLFLLYTTDIRRLRTLLGQGYVSFNKNNLRSVDIKREVP